MMAGPEAEPYIGLRYYDTGDADRFFGRATESRELTSLLAASRLVVVYGPPGVGKTSLIRAGVLPGLGKGAAQVLPIGHPPHASAFPTASTPEYNPFSFALLSTWAPDRSPGAIPGLTVSQFIQGISIGFNQYQEELPLIAIIDQFEEVFNDLPHWGVHREGFLDQLAQAIEDVPRLRLLLSTREDVVGEILPYESRLSGGYRTRYRVRPFDHEAALKAVTGPLRISGRSFAPGVAEELVDRLRTVTIVNAMGEERTVEASAVEPANLQVVCSALWRALPDSVVTITAEHLQDHGDVEATLTRFCEQAVSAVAAQEGVPGSALWEWLERTFITDLGTRGAAYEGIAATGGMPNAIARAFEQHRVLRAEKRSGSVWFELLHDGLIEPVRRGTLLAVHPGAGTGPDSRPDTYLRMAETALADGMLPLAEEYARRALHAGKHNPRTLAEAESFLGKLAFDQGRALVEGDRAEELYATAEEHYRRAAELFETEQNFRAVGRVLATLGRLFMERGRLVDAVGALEGALSRLPGNLDLHMDLAHVLRDNGQPDAALGHYRSVLNVTPENVEAIVGHGTINAESGDPTSALDDFSSAIRLQPELAERPEVVSARAQALARLERRT
jgi:tetratricopeptide (TPR) repeat protein